MITHQRIAFSRSRALFVQVLLICVAMVNPAFANPLQGFGSEKELTAYFRKLVNSMNVRLASGKGSSIEEVTVTAQKRVAGITNNQTAGVDEGDIVKLKGKYLVVLRRGRLFAVAIDEADVHPVSWINAFAPGMNPDDAWYDEMLIFEDRIIVIGYNYAHGSSDIGLFRIDESGRLAYEATMQMRSSDYYSSRNYASRLIEGQLVFYTPLSIDTGVADLPAIRKWEEFRHVSAKERIRNDEMPYQRIASANHVFRPVVPLSRRDEPTLHAITVCDLTQVELNCKSTVAIGPASRVFYVSLTALYVWTGGDDWHERGKYSPAVLYRIPLDGTNPSALKVAGVPIDQFSFYEGAGDTLNVMVAPNGDGDGMWRADAAKDGLALLRIPLEVFTSAVKSIGKTSYQHLPAPGKDSVHNRFVGGHLLYGVGDSWGISRGERSALTVVNVETGAISKLELSHGADRIEAMGGRALVVGTDKRENLHFTAIALSDNPRIGQSHVLRNAAQGELRSHGYFYRQDGVDTGLIGLPIQSGGAPGYHHLSEDSASIVLIRNADERFREIGKLEARATDMDDDADACMASCVDWYGNARPIFIGERIFGLLGYELVEGRQRGRRVIERRRISFAPNIDR
jgi:Beta propeller domain